MSLKRKPSKLWYVVAAALCLLGPAVITWAVLGNIGSLLDLPTEFKVPGSAVFHADEPGEYKVFLLTNSVASGDYRNSSEDEPKGLVVSVVRKADGQKPSLSQSMNETFTAGSKSGKSLFAFQADQAGDYVVTGQIGESGAEAVPSTVVLAVGKGFQWGSFGRMMLSGLLGGLIFLAGIVIAGVTIIRWAVFSRSDIPAQPPRI